jgi:hypothetical protein
MQQTWNGTSAIDHLAYNLYKQQFTQSGLQVLMTKAKLIQDTKRYWCNVRIVWDEKGGAVQKNEHLPLHQIN